MSKKQSLRLQEPLWDSDADYFKNPNKYKQKKPQPNMSHNPIHVKHYYQQKKPQKQWNNNYNNNNNNNNNYDSRAYQLLALQQQQIEYYHKMLMNQVVEFGEIQRQQQMAYLMSLNQSKINMHYGNHGNNGNRAFDLSKIKNDDYKDHDAVISPKKIQKKQQQNGYKFQNELYNNQLFQNKFKNYFIKQSLSKVQTRKRGKIVSNKVDQPKKPEPKVPPPVPQHIKQKIIADNKENEIKQNSNENIDNNNDNNNNNNNNNNNWETLVHTLLENNIFHDSNEKMELLKSIKEIGRRLILTLNDNSKQSINNINSKMIHKFKKLYLNNRNLKQRIIKYKGSLPILYEYGFQKVGNNKLVCYKVNKPHILDGLFVMDNEMAILPKKRNKKFVSEQKHHHSNIYNESTYSQKNYKRNIKNQQNNYKNNNNNNKYPANKGDIEEEQQRIEERIKKRNQEWDQYIHECHTYVMQEINNYGYQNRDYFDQYTISEAQLKKLPDLPPSPMNIPMNNNSNNIMNQNDGFSLDTGTPYQNYKSNDDIKDNAKYAINLVNKMNNQY